MIVIYGRAPSAMDYPMAKAQEILARWSDIGGRLNDSPDVDIAGRAPDHAIGPD